MKSNQRSFLIVAALLITSPLFAGQKAVAQSQPPLAVLTTTVDSNVNLFYGYAFGSDPVNASTGAVSSGEAFSGDFEGLAVHPSGKFVYASDNLAGILYGTTVDSVSGALTPIPGATYDFPGGTYATGIEASGRFLYLSSQSAMNPIVLGAKIDPGTGELTAIAGFPVTTGSEVGQFVSDPAGKFLYTAGYDVTAWAINQSTGALSKTATINFFAEELAPRQVAMDPQGRFVFAATGVGLYGFYNDGMLTQVPGSPFYTGASLFGAAFSGSGDFLYVAVGNVFAFSVTASGALIPVPGSPFLCTNCGNIAADASGSYLYAGVSDALTVFRINEGTGALTFVNGVWPAAGNVTPIPRIGPPTAALQSLEITGSGATLAVGSKQQFLAHGKYSDGTDRFLTASATWSTSNAAVATISNQRTLHGSATAIAPGTATITATFGGFTASTELTVP